MSASQQRPWYSFRWRIFFWIAIPFIWIAIVDSVVVYLIPPQTEQGQVPKADEGADRWMPYAAEPRAECLASGKHLLVFVYAELNQASHVALERLDVSTLAKVAGGKEYLTLIHRYDDWDDPRIRSIWQEVGHTKKPFVAHYAPGRPPCALDPFTLGPLVVKYNP
ncbi:hypothetical protein OAS39_08835 [Pirellulales bacterium]|nr:hypothetical protein [Pirellulales bacterium]